MNNHTTEKDKIYAKQLGPFRAARLR